MQERTGGWIHIIVESEAKLGSESEVLEQIKYGGIAFARVSLSQIAEQAPGMNVLQLQYIHPRCLFCDLRQGNSCKSNAAVFDLFQYFAFRTQFCFTLHDDVDPSSGTLLHQFCKTSALPSAASECH